MAAEARGRPGSVAGIASHAAVRVSERGVVVRHLRSHRPILVHQLGAQRLFAEMHIAGRDAIDGLDDLPFFVFFGHRALEYLAVARFETAHPPGCTKYIEVSAAFRRRRARRDQRSLLANRTVAIDAVDFDGGARLAVDFPVSVIVLREMAVAALHSFFEMDVGQVHGFAETVGIVERDLLAFLVEPIPFAVVVKNRAEDPAMTVEISELRGFQLLGEFWAAHVFEEFFVVPQAANRSALRIAFERLIALLFRWIALFGWIHLVAIDFVVPPCEPEIRRDHVRTRMNVADHALTRRDGARENVLNGMARLVFRNRRIGRSAEAGMPELRIGAGVREIAVVGIDHMARSATAAAIVAGMIVAPWERKDRIEQARF